MNRRRGVSSRLTHHIRPRTGAMTKRIANPLFTGAFATLALASCATKTAPEEALRIAESYAELEWKPEARHIRHSKDSKSILVHTPDTSLSEHGDKRGWWEPGVPAKGMAYKWGGFDTPESFLAGLKAGKKAGDVANTYKLRNDNAAVSDESVGIDCSGFISRCWRLSRHVSTKDLPSICDPVDWDEMRLADIILKPGHVLMFVVRRGDFIIGYESGPIPTWRARRCVIRISYLKQEGYSPWRYRNMDIPGPDASVPRYETDFSTDWTTGPY